jgi:hypothetical protein
MKFFADLLISDQLVSYQIEARDFSEANNMMSAFLCGLTFYMDYNNRLESLSAKPTRGRKYSSLGEERHER